jgi:hypothetical protein
LLIDAEFDQAHYWTVWALLHEHELAKVLVLRDQHTIVTQRNCEQLLVARPRVDGDGRNNVVPLCNEKLGQRA